MNNLPEKLTSEQEKLVVNNMPIIKKMAYYFKIKNNIQAYEFEDLFQIACLGAIHAAKKFDSKKGVEFKTYAYHWVHAYLYKETTADQLMYRPSRVVNIIKKIFIELHSRQSLDKKCTINSVIDDIVKNRQSNDLIRKTIAFDFSPTSLDAPLLLENKYSNSTLHDILEDQRSISPEKRTQEKDLIMLILEEIEKLNPQSKNIIKKRFALTDGKYYTLKEIGEEYSLTRERIRQLEKDILIKIREEVNKWIDE